MERDAVFPKRDNRETFPVKALSCPNNANVVGDRGYTLAKAKVRQIRSAHTQM